MSLTHALHSLTARFRKSPPRRRIPWAFLTKLFGFLAALLGLLRVMLELWAQAG
jgi:hypothetical protein